MPASIHCRHRFRAAGAERVRADADLLRRSLDRLRNDIRLFVHVARSELVAAPQAGGGREALELPARIPRDHQRAIDRHACSTCSVTSECAWSAAPPAWKP